MISKKLPILLLFCSLSIAANAQTLLHYWNFNVTSSYTNHIAPSSTIGNGKLDTLKFSGGNSLVDFANGNNSDLSLNLNARNSDLSGTHLRFNNPIYGALIFSLPTTGYKDIIVKYASVRSGSGAYLQFIHYTTDGVNYTLYDTMRPNTSTGQQIFTIDFKNKSVVNNNPNFKIRITFGQGGGGTAGNNRLDNFTAEGKVIPNPVLVHYWSFNNNSSNANIVKLNTSLVSGADISHKTGGTSVIDAAGGTAQEFSTNNYNARNGDSSGTHLRFNNPIGGGLEFSLPTIGYEEVKINFATRRSSSGAGAQLWYYTTNGSNYTFFDTIYPNNGAPTLKILDFSTLSAANNNANFKLKVEFIQSAGGTVGNNRFDNFTLDAVSIGGIDTVSPSIVFNPLKNKLDLPTNAIPTLTFNEAIRQPNDQAISNLYLDTIIELRKNSLTGTLVPFKSSISSSVVSISPSTTLENNQTYFLILKPKRVEDLSDNLIKDTLYTTFKTISVQTKFSIGDWVSVAYRMNAIASEDEIAFLTFKNILEGTKVNLTDAKYTTNATSQCAGGIVWTAPTGGIAAGTVISIQTSALIANFGTVSGSGFGLSSGGDQVIVYTGLNTAPNFITALSSNTWTNNNILCNGSFSNIPNGLVDGVSSISFGRSKDTVAGNVANSYYQGPQNLTLSQIKDSILNLKYWKGAASGTAPQSWPTWAFDGPPSITGVSVLNNNSIRLIFNKDLNNSSATLFSNYTGINSVSNILRTNNGTLKDSITIIFTTPFKADSSYKLTVNNVQSSDLISMFAPYSFSFTYSTTISFEKPFIVVKEDVGSLNLKLNIVNPSNASINLVLKTIGFSTAVASSDFTLATQLIQLDGSSNQKSITIPIINDTEVEQDEYFVLELQNASGLKILGPTFTTIYIKDNDKKGPLATKDIELIYKKSFDPSPTGSTCEIVVYDSISKQLYTTSAIEKRFDIIDFSNPTNPVTKKSISMLPYGEITSIAVKNGVIAVASPNSITENDGKVVFFSTNGDYIKELTVGNLPDNILFTPDGKYLLTANEGQPTKNYSIDPEGSVSIIDLQKGIANTTQADVKTLFFTNFNIIEATIIASGVRKTQKTSTLSKDLEPEYIAVASNSKKAWVICQENNAIVEIDLNTKTFGSIWALGTKNWMAAGNGMDVSDNNQEILISQWPVKSYYVPDGISFFQKNGVDYIITANEGDEKEYTGLNERTTVGATTYILDSAKFPNANFLKASHNLGRLRVTNLNGDTDGDGDFDEIFSLGSRSFSIFNADTKSIVYDSKDDFEQITSKDTNFVKVFNADNGGNGAKSRSRAKGPEPEGLALASINNKDYVFIGLERTGGVMAYDISNPNNPIFTDYKNPRNQSVFAGDNGPEGIIFISNKQSPDGKPYVIVANEVSGTLGIYEIKVNTPTIGITDINYDTKIVIYPNPNKEKIAFLSKISSGKIFNILGIQVLEFEDVQTISLSELNSGVYFIELSNGQQTKLIIE